ncbi:Uncharacterised protein [Candidatus Anstonella stagnisolia]|nr:Uncharacterised protein [Candidatus Anstonella stagnisolia]
MKTEVITSVKLIAVVFEIFWRDILQPAGGEYTASLLVILISILLGGIALGVGHAFGLKKLSLFGKEELAQAIISSALLGALALIVAGLSTGAVAFGAKGGCYGAADAPVIDFAACNMREISNSALNISQLAYKASAISGFAGSLRINIGIASTQPFASLSQSSGELFRMGSNFSLLYAIGSSWESILLLISAKALTVFFPIGLLLRSFFATRKAGAAIMGLCVSLFVFLPIFLAAFYTSFEEADYFAAAQGALRGYDERFSFLPQIDLEKENSLKSAINSLAEGDFASQTDMLFAPMSAYLGVAFDLLVLYPVISLLLSLVFARELYVALGGSLQFFWRDA